MANVFSQYILGTYKGFKSNPWISELRSRYNRRTSPQAPTFMCPQPSHKIAPTTLRWRMALDLSVTPLSMSGPFTGRMGK
jgi:hypothetical protein